MLLSIRYKASINRKFHIGPELQLIPSNHSALWSLPSVYLSVVFQVRMMFSIYKQCMSTQRGPSDQRRQSCDVPMFRGVLDCTWSLAWRTFGHRYHFFIGFYISKLIWSRDKFYSRELVLTSHCKSPDGCTHDFDHRCNQPNIVQMILLHQVNSLSNFID